MKNFSWKKLIPHIIAVVVFLAVTLFYCSPALQGKVLSQSDVNQWKGMAEQSMKYKETHGHYPLWTNSAFSGMPTYQIAMEAANPLSLGYLHFIFTLFLPHPFDYFFLLCISFYFLSQVFRIDYRIGIAAALAYAFASFSVTIVTVGHQTQVLAMGYMPFALGAFFLVFQKKYWWGAALSIVFTMLLISMIHPQITYYFLIVTACLLITYIIIWIRQKEYKHMLISLAILGGAAILGVVNNMVNIATTLDFAKATMRNSTLHIDTTNNKTTTTQGLPIDYAFQWSYAPTEIFSIIVPNIYGGRNGGKDFGTNSHLAKAAEEKGIQVDPDQFAQSFTAYWGAQPFTEAPVYLGAVMCLLFVFGLIYLKTPDRWWIVAACALAILMSLGKNFAAFNDFLFDHLPMYNKFRVPTMALVIPQLLFPLLGMMALNKFIFHETDKAYALNKLKTTGFTMLAIFAVLAFMYTSFDYKGIGDGGDSQTLNYLNQATQNNKDLVNSFYNALKLDRQSLFGSDLLRSVIFAGLAFAALWFMLKNKIKPVYAMLAVLLLSSVDLLALGRRYLNEDDFQDAISPDESVFTPTAADQQILKDTGYYRVLNLTGSFSEESTTSYFHNSLGGYNPARLSVYDDMLTYQLRRQQPNLNVINMLNTKYVIVPDAKNQPVAQQNPGALGPVWFVKGIRFTEGPAETMKALNTLDTKDSAIVEGEYKSNITAAPVYDSAAQISLLKNDNDIITYKSRSSTNEFAVFSEIFYDRGWKAYIDNKETPIVKTDYALRGLSIPAGEHTIRFEFKPASYYNSLKIAIAASIISWLVIIAAIFFSTRKKAVV